MTSSIVRNQIANSTIDHIIKNRQLLRSEIIKEMNEVVKGWGVHLVTVEVTDVKVLSSSLFKDMQTKFREENVKKATIERWVVENSIYFEQLEKNLEKKKRDAQTDKVRCEAQNAEELKRTRQEIDQFRQQIALERKEIERHNDEKIRAKQNELTVKMKDLERELEATVREVDKACRMEQSRREK